MKIKSIFIEMFDWKIKVIEVENHEKKEIEKIRKLFEDYLDNKAIKEFFKYLTKWKAVDGGMYFRLGTKDGYIIIYPTKNENKKRNILIHELYHCVTDISETLLLNSEETEAYLLSYLTDKFIKNENNN